MSQRFKVKDSKGNTYVAYKISGQRYETTDIASMSPENLDGRARYELEDGRALDYHDDTGEFEIVATGERVTRA